MIYPDFSILIATKDRPENVEKLLRSIAESTTKPKFVVLISSGHPIHNIVSKYMDKLKIDYFHSEITGQVNQKKIGIARLQKEIPWVVFLDDDLLLSPNCLEKAFETLSHHNSSGENIVGIGLGLTPTARLKRSSRVQNLVGSALRLSSGSPGRVISSGQGVSYLENTEPIFTQWLNGASIWRIESALDYTSLVPSTRYAACEDLVFSYQQSKKGKLLFAPEARVTFQVKEPNNYNSGQVIISATAWRYFFVKTNPELSEWQLIYSQLGRLVYILATQPWNQDAVRAGIWSVKHLIISVLRVKDPMYLINKIS